jgi:hypothetical protein
MAKKTHEKMLSLAIKEIHLTPVRIAIIKVRAKRINLEGNTQAQDINVSQLPV